MLRRKFRETGPDVVILIGITLLLTWTGAILHPHLPADMGYDIKPMPLYGLLVSVTSFSPLFSVIVACLLVLLIAILLVNLNTSAFFISERNFFPALIYILLSCYFPKFQILNPALPAAPFLILGLRKIIESYKVQGTAFSLFDAGLLISTGCLFYASLIWFGLLLIIGIAVLRTGSIKEIIISVLGLAAPLFIVYGFFYVSGKDMDSMMSAITYNLFTKDGKLTLQVLTLVVLIISGVTVLISVTQLLLAINSKKIKSRKTFIILLWAILIVGGAAFLSDPVSAEIHWFAAIPASYFLTHYFVFSRRKLIPEIMLVALFMLTAVVQVANLFQ
ncbi:MAG TPA: hypothetical protein DEO60_14590 [Bacteroidales bacterium]|nr:hypothetical protein [Bacteroidales bacterium]HBZ22358.1 hypothetical protein [Bacteroidales bacterium]